MPCLAILRVPTAAGLHMGKEAQRRCGHDGDWDDVPNSERQNHDGEEINFIGGVTGVTATLRGRDLVAVIGSLKRRRCLHLDAGELPRAAGAVAFAGLDDEVIGRGLPVGLGDDQAAARRLPNKGTLPRFAGELGEAGTRHGVLEEEKARASGAGFSYLSNSSIADFEGKSANFHKIIFAVE